jgi:hypothetical protein
MEAFRLLTGLDDLDAMRGQAGPADLSKVQR